MAPIIVSIIVPIFTTVIKELELNYRQQKSINSETAIEKKLTT